MDRGTQAFYDYFNLLYPESRGGMTMRFDYEISNEELDSHDGSLVHMETGYLLATGLDNIPAHPFSHASLLSDMWPHRSTDDAGVSYLLADREGNIGKRYINDRGQVIRLDPVTDFQQPDGLYIRYLNPGENGEPPTKEIRHIPAAEIPKQEWLHKTHRAAQHDGGVVVLDRELQLKDKELEVKDRTLAANLEKATLERSASEDKFLQEQELRRLDALRASETHRLLIEENQMKTKQLLIRDNYESASMARKDSSEIVKYFGPVVVAIVTGLGYFFSRGK